jgi:NCAIR mutase (PurE)-related protein
MKKRLSLLLTILLSSTQVLAASVYETSTSVLDDFDVRAAINNMKDLQDSVEEITQELYSLDKKETTDGQISQKYRDTRVEIVRVIQTINTTTDDVSTMLKKMAVYKKQIFLSQKELETTKAELEKTKQYMQEFTNFMYKVDQ